MGRVAPEAIRSLESFDKADQLPDAIIFKASTDAPAQIQQKGCIHSGEVGEETARMLRTDGPGDLVPKRMGLQSLLTQEQIQAALRLRTLSAPGMVGQSAHHKGRVRSAAESRMRQTPIASREYVFAALDA
jgi:hypothetical protein